MKCDNCKKHDDCASGSGLVWPCGAYAPKIVTNADRIRAMSDEELATFISEIADNCETSTSCHQHCYGCDVEYCEYRMCLNWLRQPTEGE